MTNQERIIQQHMEIFCLEDQNLILKRALREALIFVKETALNLSYLGENRDLQCTTNYLQNTISRGIRLDETYRRLLDE